MLREQKNPTRWETQSIKKIKKRKSSGQQPDWVSVISKKYLNSYAAEK